MSVKILLEDPKIKAAFDFIEANRENIIEEITRITAIPSPSYHEQELAAYYAARLKDSGVEDVRVDHERNAWGVIRGTNEHPALLMNAHLDTVFPLGTDLTVRREGERLYGPGVGDDSTGLAALLWAVRALRHAGIQLKGDLYVAGNSCEEGLGDLKGMKALMAQLKDKVDMVIPVEPSMLGRIANQGVGSRRFRVTAKTTGGHSFGAFGIPSAIHALCQVVSKISEIQVPREPKTTYNVGKFHGGVSINTIAPEAVMEVDMRSVSQAELEKVEKQVHAIIESVAKSTGVTMETLLVGDRPAGTTPEASPLIGKMKEVHHALGVKSIIHAGSTDANVPMWMGIPAATIGVTVSSGSHSIGEYIELGPLTAGVKQIVLLMVYLLS